MSPEQRITSGNGEDSDYIEVARDHLVTKGAELEHISRNKSTYLMLRNGRTIRIADHERNDFSRRDHDAPKVEILTSELRGKSIDEIKKVVDARVFPRQRNRKKEKARTGSGK